MFIGPCIISIFDEWKTKLMSLAILFHLLCAQHVSDINKWNKIASDIKLVFHSSTMYRMKLFCRDPCSKLRWKVPSKWKLQWRVSLQYATFLIVLFDTLCRNILSMFFKSLKLSRMCVLMFFICRELYVLHSRFQKW